MKTIDKSDEINLIRKRYVPDFFRCPDAKREAARVWGVTLNDNGSLHTRQERIVKVGQCEAELSFAESDTGHCLLGLSVMSSFSGRVYSPSVWDGIGYASYVDARKAGVKKLIDFFQDVAQDRSGCNNTSNKKNAIQAVSLLRAELTPQLVLF